MLHHLFATQKEYIDHFFSAVDLQQAEKILETFLACKGSLFFFGVGKSGLIAEKLAMTMVSTGTKAFYLSIVNLPHGDMGILSPEDLCIFISKSGETRELLRALPYIAQKKVKTMAWVSQENSSLAKECDLAILLPLKQELCPFGLAPTTSTAIQLIFGDVLAIAMMQRRFLTLADYAKNHPAGTIGSLATTTVEEVMLSGEALPVCHPQDQLKDVLVEFSNKRCGCLVIVNEDNKVEGIFTDGDLRRALQKKSSSLLEERMHNLMTKHFLAIEKERLLQEALQIMQVHEHKKVLVLPVIHQEKLVGLIHMHDIVKANA